MKELVGLNLPVVAGKCLVLSTALLFWGISANADEFGRGARRNLLNVATSDLPQGKVQLNGGERVTGPGKRSPWHTSGGPKLLYVVSGSLTVQGLNGKTLLTCGPGPKLCLSMQKELFFFANRGSSPAKFVVVGIDPVENLTSHEYVGEITRIDRNSVTIAVGDVKTSRLTDPRKEVAIQVKNLTGLAVGDNVVTYHYRAKKHSASRLFKLSERWR